MRGKPGGVRCVTPWRTRFGARRMKHVACQVRNAAGCCVGSSRRVPAVRVRPEWQMPGQAVGSGSQQWLLVRLVTGWWLGFDSNPPLFLSPVRCLPQGTCEPHQVCAANGQTHAGLKPGLPLFVWLARRTGCTNLATTRSNYWPVSSYPNAVMYGRSRSLIGAKCFL